MTCQLMAIINLTRTTKHHLDYKMKSGRNILVSDTCDLSTLPFQVCYIIASNKSCKRHLEEKREK